MKLLMTKKILYTISHEFLIFSKFSSGIKNVAFYFSKHESFMALGPWLRGLGLRIPVTFSGKAVQFMFYMNMSKIKSFQIIVVKST